MASLAHQDRVEASKAYGREDNERQLRHTASRGRKDAAWASVAAASGEHAQAERGQLTKDSSGEHIRVNLRAALDEQQLRTFTRWWNAWLSEVQLKVTHLCDDVKPGVYPIKLLEILSDSSCGRYNKNPQMY